MKTCPTSCRLKLQIPFFGIVLILLLAAAAGDPAGRSSSTPVGAWSKEVNTGAENVTHVLLFDDHYFSWTTYKTASGAFLSTKGGSWTMKGRNLQLVYEFDTAEPSSVGTTGHLKAKIKVPSLRLSGAGVDEGPWAALDQGIHTELSGAWLMAGRKRDGEIVRRDTNVPRKTMKILTGTCFQWIAYNTETKEFFGTGGGTYEARDGKYTERLVFFSRDDKKVGMELQFDFRVEGDDWHHSGLNSSGQSLYEVWARRK